MEHKKIAMLKKIVLHRFKLSLEKLDGAAFKVAVNALDVKIIRDAVEKAALNQAPVLAPVVAPVPRGGLFGYFAQG